MPPASVPPLSGPPPIPRRSPELLFVGAELVRDLPLLDPDLDAPDRLPSVVREFRLLAGAASGGIVSSPEYVHSASGVTKNALDWLAGSTGLYGKPVLLTTLPDGEVVEAGLHLRLDIALEQFSAAMALAGRVVRP